MRKVQDLRSGSFKDRQQPLWRIEDMTLETQQLNHPFFEQLQSSLIEQIREGVLLISQTQQAILLNLKAKKLCQKLGAIDSVAPAGKQHEQKATSEAFRTIPHLPKILQNTYQRVQSHHSVDSPFIMDYQVNEEQAIRIRAYPLSDRYLDIPIALTKEHDFVLVLLEDRKAVLAEDLKVQQEQYQLTDRETEILQRLSQAHTYQDIAKSLCISLNTVKFHVKNINSKRRAAVLDDSYQYPKRCKI
jgi:DNA-binding CsgD family transcriptional regulator